MIPSRFDYVRPGSVDEAVATLQHAGEDAKILAGGQSLIPAMKLRLAHAGYTARPEPSWPDSPAADAIRG